MDKIKAIGNRCSILIKDTVFSLVILPTDNKRKTWLLFLWLIAWTVGGVIVIANYFTVKDLQQSVKLFMIIWLGFWSYFEFKIMRVFMWKQFGKEKLWIKKGIIYYQHSINNRGKIKEYNINLITDIGLIPIDTKNFADVFAQTFWVKGGERIQFTSQAHTVKFGMQLTNDDAQKVISEFKHFLNVAK